MKKIVIVKSENLITWKSCKSISANVLSAYQNLNSQIYECEPVVFNETYKDKSVLTAEKIFLLKPHAIAFIDHFPHPGELIGTILKTYGQTPLPELIIYTYGDFTMNFKWWAECEEALKHFTVRFFAASHKQKELISKMIAVPELVHHVPYPVEKSHFYFDLNKREVARQKLGYKSEDFVFLYAGRLSRQKSILELVQAFSKSPDTSSYLLLAGEFDDLGVPYLNRREDFNQYFSEYQALLQSLPLEIQSRIRHIGNLGYDKLPYAYNAADTYVSLSVHNDEDFGMAPAEAACSGLPLLLTDWAGLSSFKMFQPEFCELIPVSIGAKAIEMRLEFLMSRSASDQERQLISCQYNESLSIEAVSKKMDRIFSQASARFEGFSPLFHQLAQREEKTFSNQQGGFNDLYRSLYESYV